MLSIVIPTLNEKENIGRLISTIESSVKLPHEIIIVDDDSKDGTVDLITRLQRKMGAKLRLIRRKERGLGGAILTGLKAARGEFIATMDADLSHYPSDIGGMLRALDGHDVVVGSRYLKGSRVKKISFHRLIISKGANILTRLLLGLTPSDLTNNFRIYRKSALSKIDLAGITNTSFSCLVEILYLLRRKGASFTEYPIRFGEREGGLSKLSYGQYIKFAETVFRLKLSEYV